MECKSPNIIFNIEAHLPGSNSEKNSFYRCKNKRNIVNYSNRENAVNSSIETRSSEVDQICADLNVSAGSIASYVNNRPGSTGSFNTEKMLDEKDLLAYQEKLKSTQSIVWSAVLSFTPEIAAAFCKNKDDAQNLLNENLPILFKDTKFDISNIDWFGSYHRNTDNPHVHFVMFEKLPLVLKDGKKCYNDKYKLPIDNIRNFTANMNRSFDPFKFPVYNLRDEIRTEFNLYCKQPVMLLNYTSDKLKEIKDKGIFQYAKLNEQEQDLIRCFVDGFIDLNLSAKKKFDEYTSFLLNFQAHSLKMYKDNHYKTVPKNISSFYDNRINEFYSRLGNTLLYSLKHYDDLQKKKDNLANKQNDEKAKKQIGKNFASKGALVVAARAQRLKVMAAKEIMIDLINVSRQFIEIDLEAFYDELNKKENESTV